MLPNKWHFLWQLLFVVNGIVVSRIAIGKGALESVVGAPVIDHGWSLGVIVSIVSLTVSMA